MGQERREALVEELTQVLEYVAGFKRGEQLTEAQAIDALDALAYCLTLTIHASPLNSTKAAENVCKLIFVNLKKWEKDGGPH